MHNYLTLPSTDRTRAGDVLWEDEENAAIVALASELTAEVRSWVGDWRDCGIDFASVAVTAEMRHGPTHLVLRLLAPDLPGCGEVTVEAGPGGDLFVCWTAEGEAEQEVYSTTHRYWNAGSVEWIDVVPVRIAELLIGEVEA